MDLGAITPYGRSFDEYRLMFGLGETEAGKRILGIGDGPSNFNAIATKRGWRVRSVDPLYCLSPREIEARVGAGMDKMVSAVALVPTHWIWSLHENADALWQHRRRTAHDFVEDFSAGNTAGRYVAGELPHLPVMADRFDIALCSHLLFSWSRVLDLAFHKNAIADMLRVASEVRVCPTGKNLGLVRSRHFDPVVEEFRARGCHVHTEPMSGQSPSASSEQLIIRRPAIVGVKQGA
jgi:hypothetical protein